MSKKWGDGMRPIDADELCEGRVNNDPVKIAAMCAPTIEAVPVVHGEWVNGKCSICGACIPTDCAFDYLSEEDCCFCYACGADMRKKV